MESKGRSLDGRFLVPRSIDDSRVLSHLVGASNALLVLEGTRKLCNIFWVVYQPSHAKDSHPPSIQSICLTVLSIPSTLWLVSQLSEILQVAVLLFPY